MKAILLLVPIFLAVVAALDGGPIAPALAGVAPPVVGPLC